MTPTQKNPAAADRPIEPIAVRIPEATRITGWCRSKLYTMANEGQIVFKKSGKSVLIDYRSLRAAYDALPVAVLNIAA